MSDYPEFEPFQTDHLFLLVGGNPLPNYVAAMLLSKTGGTVHLLHTRGAKGTGNLAVNLKTAIQRGHSQVRVILYEMDDSDSSDITKQVNVILPNVRGTVGLNYTGGTKPMATHTYRAITAKFPDAIFTYLDPRQLRMIVDQRKDTPMQIVTVGNQVQLSLQHLVALHGYQLNDVRKTPQLGELATSIALLNSTPNGYSEWRKKFLDAGHSTTPRSDNSGGLNNTIEMIAKIDKNQYSNFLNGMWLEEFTLAELGKVPRDFGLTDYGISIRPTHHIRPPFELDVAVMYGYQLFAISCIITDKKSFAKEHLLEVFTRAQQLGGEEARSALVCCLPNPSLLESELAQDWDIQGKVRVFGMKELPRLSDYLGDWFVTANKG